MGGSCRPLEDHGGRFVGEARTTPFLDFLEGPVLVSVRVAPPALLLLPSRPCGHVGSDEFRMVYCACRPNQAIKRAMAR